MKKLILYGIKNKIKDIIASLYMRGGKIIVEAKDPKVKEDLEKEINKFLHEEGVQQGKGGATIRVTNNGELIIEAMDPEVAEALRNEVRVEKKGEGYYIATHAGYQGNPIYITYLRPKSSTDPDYLDLFWAIFSCWLSEGYGKKQFGDYQIDFSTSKIVDE